MAVGGRSIPWTYVGLGALSLVAAVLVVLALRDPTPPEPTVVVDATPRATALAEPTPADDAGQTPQVDEPLATDPQRERPLAALSARSAARGVVGTCPGGGAAIEVSDDQGKSWQPVATPTDQLLRVARPGEDALWFVGASGRECATGFTISENSGRTWVGPSDTTGAWHMEVDPGATTLHAPYATVDSPCGRRTTLELEASTFEEASVLCGNGEVYSTVNSGVSWASAGRTPQAVAMAVITNLPVVAVPSAGDCVGLAVGSPGAEPIGCIEGASPSDVAMSFRGASAGWVVADDQTWTSNDGGTTWTRRQ